MLSNWIKATTTTTGTGTLTLSAVSGRPLPSAIHAVGEYVEYAIDTSDGKFEAGIGKIGTSDTLERSRISSTYDGSTYNNISATALSLASGTHTVLITPIAESLFSAFPTIPANSGVLHSTHINSNTSQNTALNDYSRATCWPFLIESSVIITGFAVNCTTSGGSGSIVHAGLYAPLISSGNPGRRICTTTTAFDTSSTGSKTSTLSANIRLIPGWYWVALVCSGGTAVPAFSGNSGHRRTPFGGTNGQDSSLLSVRYNTGSDTTLPDPFYTSTLAWTNSTNGSIPAIGLICS
jgi:hypothetical protein